MLPAGAEEAHFRVALQLNYGMLRFPGAASTPLTVT